MTFSLLVFDLDGTLIDGYEAIGDALAYAMRGLGLPAPRAEQVRSMVGHGLEKLLEKAAGPGLAPDGVRLFRERFPRVAVAKSHLLPGVAEVLETLDRRGYLMAVASNKPPEFSREILEAKGVGRRFRRIAGPDRSTPVKPDPTMLRRVMEDLGTSPGATLVVGDMEVDLEFARAAGCRVLLIPGGSRSREELEGLEADGMLETIEELPAWLEATRRPPVENRR